MRTRRTHPIRGWSKIVELEKIERTGTSSVLVPLDAWRSFLAEETMLLDMTGTRAGVISAVMVDEESPARDLSRSIRLIRHSIPSSDRLTATSATSLSLLCSPLNSLPALERRARRHAVQLEMAGLVVAVGFAHRRVDEDLVDTWARADAEADRVRFRMQNPGGGLRIR